jgi:hypothetical protein
MMKKLAQPTSRLRLDRSTARYIYKAKNGKLLVVLTPSQKQNLYLNNIYKLYLTKIFFKPSCTDILKILEKELFCSVKGYFKALWLFETKAFISKVVNNF